MLLNLNKCVYVFTEKICPRFHFSYVFIASLTNSLIYLPSETQQHCKQSHSANRNVDFAMFTHY